MASIGCAWAWITDHATVLSAVVSALAAVAIAGFTIKLTRATTRQARLTRNGIAATKRIADAALAAELPIVLVQEIELSEWVGFGKPFTVIGGGFPPERSKVRFIFHNYGRSVARLTSFCLEHKVVYDLREPPIYKSIASLPTGLVIQRDQSLAIVPDDSQLVRISESDMGRIAEKSPDLARLWVYGYIEFRDFRGESHRTGFCYLWHSNQVGLEIEQRLGFHEGGPEEYIYNT